MIDCMNCGKLCNMADLPAHRDVCGGGKSSSTSTSSSGGRIDQYLKAYQSSSAQEIQDVIPEASEEDILGALEIANEDKNAAIDHLLSKQATAVSSTVSSSKCKR